MALAATTLAAAAGPGSEHRAGSHTGRELLLSKFAAAAEASKLEDGGDPSAGRGGGDDEEGVKMFSERGFFPVAEKPKRRRKTLAETSVAVAAAAAHAAHADAARGALAPATVYAAAECFVPRTAEAPAATIPGFVAPAISFSPPPASFLYASLAPSPKKRKARRWLSDEQKTFACGIGGCDRSYGSASSLCAHKRAHHPGWKEEARKRREAEARAAGADGNGKAALASAPASADPGGAGER